MFVENNSKKTRKNINYSCAFFCINIYMTKILNIHYNYMTYIEKNLIYGILILKGGKLDNMKKVTIFFIILLFIISISSTVSANSNLDINVSVNKDSIHNGEEIVLSLSLSNLRELGDGVNAYVMTLHYNTSQFDFVKAEGSNSWNAPMYNNNSISTGNMKLVSTISNFTTDENEFLRITLKAKQDINNSDANVSFDNISFAAKINSKTTKILAKDIKVEFSNISNSNENDNSNNSENSNENKKENISNVSNKPLPYTGKGMTLIITIFIVFFISIIIYVRYKNLKKYLK